MSAGIQSVVSFIKEASWGVALTPTKSLPVKSGGGIEVKKNVKMQSAIKGQLQKNYAQIAGLTTLDGSYTFDAFADYLGYFLLSALGTDTPALKGGETIVYDHVFTETAPKTSLTVEQAQGENVQRYAGTICNELKFVGKVDEMLEVTANCVAKTYATATAITPAFSTVPAFNWSQLAVKIGGASIGEVESFELNYKNGAEMVGSLNGVLTPSYTTIKSGSEVSGKLVMYLDATALTRFTNYLANTTEALEIIATGGSIGSASTYKLDITVPVAVYTTGVTKITDDHNLLEVDFEGIYDVSTSKMIGVTLTNLVTAY